MMVRFEPGAEADLDVAEAWLDGLNPGSGRVFAGAAQRTVAQLAASPRMHPRANRPPRGREVRHALVPGYLFLVTYEVTATEIVVWSVGHARQRSQGWRRRMSG